MSVGTPRFVTMDASEPQTPSLDSTFELPVEGTEAEPIAPAIPRDKFRILMPLLGGAALVVAVLALVFAVPGYRAYTAADPTKDGFVPPRNLFDTVEMTQKSVVTIYCDLSKTYDQGSGWSISKKDLLPLQDAEAEKKLVDYATAIVTNHHVIEDCIKDGTLSVFKLGKTYYPIIIADDKKRDLAILSINQVIPPLGLSSTIPSPGWWVMTLGTPLGLEGSITFGNIISMEDEFNFLTTSNISSGGSGGPIVDNEGNVIGTSVATLTEHFTYEGIGLNSLCDSIADCKKREKFWKE